MFRNDVHVVSHNGAVGAFEGLHFFVFDLVLDVEMLPSSACLLLLANVALFVMHRMLFYVMLTYVQFEQ